MSLRSEKRRAQVKSRFYYIFWGAATISVFIGQIYVGSGYRQFANTLNRLFYDVDVELHQTRFY